MAGLFRRLPPLEVRRRADERFNPIAAALIVEDMARWLAPLADLLATSHGHPHCIGCRIAGRQPATAKTDKLRTDRVAAES